MKLGLLSAFSSFLPIALSLSGVACSGANQSGVNNQNDVTTDGGGPANDGPPHALGVISLGFEVDHASATETSSSPSLAASFIPDSTQLPPACSKTIDGCTVPTVPTCNPNGVPAGCQTGQTCVLDDQCVAVCQEECTLPCGPGEECYFVTENAQSCRMTSTFDAGYLVFSGTTTPITLYPPYTFDPAASEGSLFAPGQSITVTAAGAVPSATSAGFAPFTESFTGTALLQTNPSLALLSGDEVFGAGGFSVGWQPGSDTVTIGVSGPGGTASCPANDATGTFTVPAAVVTAVAEAPGISGPSPTYGTATVTVSVTRQRLSEKTDEKTIGSLPNATVQPIGYLDLSTYSTETVTVTGEFTPPCPSGDTLCSDGCQNLLASSTDCGTCGTVCGAGTYCSGGACVPGAACPTGYTRCADGCQNVTDSDTDCGACGNSCATGTYCSSGECISGTGGCGAGYTQCSDGCQYLLDSDTDCGSCGNVCASGSYCSDGVCTSTTSCVAPLTSCSGVCVSLLTSSTNCGACGVTCPSGEYCSEGVCSVATTCESPDVECSDGCQNLQTSATDCGSCGNSCDGGTCAGGVCQAETCASCEATAEAGTCAADYNSCEADANCSSYATCVSGCAAGNTTCVSNCKTEYPTGASEAEALQTCICSTECFSECETDSYCTETL